MFFLSFGKNFGMDVYLKQMERLEIDLLEIFFKMFKKNDKFLILVVGFVIIKFGKGILLVRNFGNLI